MKMQIHAYQKISTIVGNRLSSSNARLRFPSPAKSKILPHSHRIENLMNNDGQKHRPKSIGRSFRCSRGPPPQSTEGSLK